MQRYQRSWPVALRILAALLISGWHCAPALSGAQTAPQKSGYASGVVFHDRNRNGVHDAGEPGVPGVRVSNQRDVVVTDPEGRYRIPVGDDTILFVIKPRGWMTPISDTRLPRFHYIHKPAGSPSHLRYPGVSPTGPLPPSVDFPLYPQREPNRFRVLLFGDTQPRNQQEIDYIAHDVVEGLIGFKAAFGITLGDIMFDDLSLFDSLNRTIGLIGIPWYNVLGNHDMNFDAADDRHSDETFERHFGPSYYAFDYGPVHFLVLDDVIWTGATAERPGSYRGGLGQDQLEFIRQDLAHVPRNQLVVLLMHIPIIEIEEREALFRLLEDRPHTLSISAHTHIQRHLFLGPEQGWRGRKPHHHFNSVTVCGSWWTGAPDERGIPHTTMRDGAPNGYSILNFSGNRYTIEFCPARRPASHQMNIYAPDSIASAESGQTQVLVNVFAGSERSKVEMRLGERGSWIPMQRVDIEDPDYARLKQMERSDTPPPGRRLPEIIKSPHIWQATLPPDAPAGTHLIHVRTTDMFGRTYRDCRVIRIR